MDSAPASRPLRVDPDRLARTFTELVSVDSPSREEGAVAALVRRTFEALGAEVEEDETRSATGSQSGNLVVRVPGALSVPPPFFCAHLDTVEPGRGVRVRFEDGVFRSDGTTVLGADDKAAVACLAEAVRCLRERGAPHPPVEFLFTVCEEIGLLGAKALDPELLRARAGYALDSTDTDLLINRAPAAIRYTARVLGRSAHAGLNPEAGINAIRVAAEALVRVPTGRIDPETTANVGVIRGGAATNIVPEEVVIEGEVRSHDPARLREVQDAVLAAFHGPVLEAGARPAPPGADPPLPRVQTEVRDDYPLLHVPEDAPVVRTALEAAAGLGRPLRLHRTGGGSDANVLCGKGLSTVILGIGMADVHTTAESIRLSDMVATTELVGAILDRWSGRRA
ncbi:M20/M25/M40 family metallo-hydrolase [Dissulfurirhabdus thermomarina]|uniref:M20/M25/M40 family metallo-hydrolase n=1 Tax=Dissulfurirhabdus thermomarina TaxID=1765737 RepID=A0A6N9TY27_DISTH|nr:M20/M25/M40 family metallo-hydrolase [Dissulfurirhabdus thermomarina]NDY43386.1 M20/M25/M40 family metallo-hydrolase [Dissulfurirhabdus thermomarina]NMX22596.1 M20/M25/M40 family metallo-hydrolase [Dissulfurirhabdus thermomarina]